MIASNQRKNTAARRNAGGLLFRLLPCLMVPWMAGCHASVSTPKTPAVQQPAALATPGTGEEPTWPASGSQAKAVKAEVSGVAPRMAVEKEVCDLGEIGTDTKHTGQFRFTNPGTAPLKIVLVRACCGVAIKGVEAGRQYAPGASGALEFTFQAPSLPSPAVARVISLQTNDPEHGTTSLTLKASVVRRVDCNPKSLTLALRGPNAGCPDLVLTSLDHRPFSITNFKATLGAITAPFDPGAKATEFTLKPQVDLAELRQQRTGRISIDLTHPECTNVQVSYVVLPEFTISPPNMVLFELKAGQAVPREFRIRSNYQEDFEIESVSSQKGTVTLVEKSKTDNDCRLRVEITPPAPEGRKASLSDTLQVKIRDGQTLLIPCRGFYQDN